MNKHTEVRRLTTKMNLKNSLEPHIGSSSFPINRRLNVLTTTYKIVQTMLIVKFSYKQDLQLW